MAEGSCTRGRDDSRDDHRWRNSAADVYAAHSGVRAGHRSAGGLRRAGRTRSGGHPPARRGPAGPQDAGRRRAHRSPMDPLPPGAAHGRHPDDVPDRRGHRRGAALRRGRLPDEGLHTAGTGPRGPGAGRRRHRTVRRGGPDRHRRLPRHRHASPRTGPAPGHAHRARAPGPRTARRRTDQRGDRTPPAAQRVHRQGAHQHDPDEAGSDQPGAGRRGRPSRRGRPETPTGHLAETR